MNVFFRLACPLLLAAAVLPSIASAQEAPALPTWDQLTPAQRELLIAPVRDRWNREPDKRAQFLDFAQRWKQMPPGRRDHARRGMDRWETMSPEQREHARALFHAVRGMDKESRRAFMQQWRQMSREQRNDWVRAHPAPQSEGPAR